MTGWNLFTYTVGLTILWFSIGHYVGRTDPLLGPCQCHVEAHK